jgi:hypothetical protein
MGRFRAALGIAPLIILLAACGSSAPASTTGGGGAPSVAASAPASMVASEAASIAATPTAAPTESATEEPSLASAKPTAVNPCDLVTRDEASTLAGVTLAKGKESTLDNNGKLCTYSVQTTLFNVEAIEAPDQATMDAAKQQALAQLQKNVPKGIKVGAISGVGDQAELATGSPTLNGVTVNVIGLYFTDGTYFVAISDIGLGHGVASADALAAEAQTAISRLP